MNLRIGILTLGGLLACVSTASEAAGITTLHPGDKISITVYNHPELSSPVSTVNGTGQISVPVAGLVDGYGITPGALAARIAGRLSPYIRKPAVDVQVVAQGQNIFVSGGPGGVLPYAPGETLSSALAQLQSGGFTTSTDPSQIAAHQLQYGSVDLHRVVIERDGQDLPVVDAAALIAVANPGPRLQPDDIVKLVEKPVAVSVGGEVKQPGVAHLDSFEPLSNALVQVGGTNDASSSQEFVLTRGGEQKTITTSSPEYSAPAQVGDAIYIPHGQRVSVVGQVYKPGPVLLQGDDSLLSALYYAGGPTKYGNIKSVSVVHAGVEKEYDVTALTHGAPGQNPQLADGDTVFVPEGHKIDLTIFFQALISLSALRFL